MARAPKGGAKSEPVIKSPAASTLKTLLKSAARRSESVGDINLKYASEVKALVDSRGLHAKAWGMVVSLNRMTPEKLRELMLHFRKYYEDVGLQEREESAPTLEDAANEKEGEQEEEDPPKVVKGRFPIAAE